MKVEWFFRFVPDCREKVKSNQQFMGCRLFLLFTSWVMSNSLQPHGLQLTRHPCSSLSPRVCLDSCPLSCWCYLTISSSVAPFSFCFQSFPAPGSFPMSQLFPSGGQCTGASSSASLLPKNIQGWFSLGLSSLISLLPKGLSRDSPFFKPRRGLGVQSEEEYG